MMLGFHTGALMGPAQPLSGHWKTGSWEETGQKCGLPGKAGPGQGDPDLSVLSLQGLPLLVPVNLGT